METDDHNDLLNFVKHCPTLTLILTFFLYQTLGFRWFLIRIFLFLYELHWPAKKIPENKFSIFIWLFPCWIWIWNPFFPITSRFSKKIWQKSKNQQNRLVLECVYAEVDQQIQHFAYVKCFLMNTFHPDVKFQN